MESFTRTLAPRGITLIKLEAANGDDGTIFDIEGAAIGTDGQIRKVVLAALERNSTDAARESTNLKVARVDLAVDMHLGVVKNQIQIVVNEELILGEILVILGVEARVELGDVEDAAFLNRDRLGGELVRIKGGFEGCAVFDIDILELDLAVVDGLAVVER